MVTLSQYCADPDAAAEQIRDQIRENLAEQGIPVNSKAGLIDMLTRFEVINLEISRLHHRVLDLEANHATE
jgi:hypothetical protein